MGKHMNLEQRLKLKEMLEAGRKVCDIADALGFYNTGVYKEIARGSIEGNYDPYYAQSLHEENSKRKGCSGILSDKGLARYISDLILIEHLSPEKIVALLAEDDKGFPDVPQSKNTIYSAIDKGLIPNVTRESLYTKVSTVFNGGQVCIPRWVYLYCQRVIES